MAMDNITKFFRTYREFLGFAAILICLGGYLLFHSNKGDPQYEVGRILISFSLAVIIGSIFKQHIDNVKDGIKRNRSLIESISEKIISLNKAKTELQSARLYISAHQSALSYGKAIREQLIPIETQLKQVQIELDSLIDISSLDLTEHFNLVTKCMETLKEDYIQQYLSLSHKQSYIEEKKKRIVNRFIDKHDKKATLTEEELNMQLEKIDLPSLDLTKAKINNFIETDSVLYANISESIQTIIGQLTKKKLNLKHGNEALS